jgi:hypothetical protein
MYNQFPGSNTPESGKEAYAKGFTPNPNRHTPSPLMEILTSDNQRILCPMSEVEQMVKQLGDRTYTIKAFVPEEKK